MAFKKVGNGNFKYLKYAECEEGQVLATGTYLGSRQGTYGIQHQIREDGGDVTVLNSSGHLNFLLENHVSKGDYIQVIYRGTETMKKGKFKGKDMHQFEVAVDDERGRDDSAAPIASATVSADDDDDVGGEDEDEDDVVDEPTPKRAKPPVEEDEDETAVVAQAAVAKKKMSQEELLSKYRKNK